MENKLIFGFSTVILLYLLYRLFNRPNREVEREINEILTSNKYEVKGQYD